MESGGLALEPPLRGERSRDAGSRLNPEERSTLALGRAARVLDRDDVKPPDAGSPRAVELATGGDGEGEGDGTAAADSVAEGAGTAREVVGVTPHPATSAVATTVSNKRRGM